MPYFAIGKTFLSFGTPLAIKESRLVLVGLVNMVIKQAAVMVACFISFPHFFIKTVILTGDSGITIRDELSFIKV
jgi:hypothetical protein